MAAPIQRTGPGTRTLGRPAIGRGGAKSESPAPRRRSGRRTRRALDVELREDAPRRGYVASEAARVDDWLRNGPGRIRAGYGEPGGAHPARREQRAGREGRVLREATRPPPPTARPAGRRRATLGPVLPLLKQRPYLSRHAPHQQSWSSRESHEARGAIFAESRRIARCSIKPRIANCQSI